MDGWRLCIAASFAAIFEFTFPCVVQGGGYMFKRILVPLDESALAECVLPHVAALAHAFRAQVTLLHVLDRGATPDQILQVDPFDWHLRWAEMEAYLERVCNNLNEAGVETDTVLLEGRVAGGMIDYARQHDFDLIVLSSHGQSGLSRWNVSSVVQKVILRAYKSIMVVRAYEQPIGDAFAAVRYGRILVPLDGSWRAECALPIAVNLARHHQAELLLAHVVARPAVFNRLPPSDEVIDLVERLTHHNQAKAADYLEQLHATLPVPSQTRLLISNNNVVNALHELVEEENVDLVLLCAHGRSCKGRWPYGSVVSNFITNGATPLLIFQDLSVGEIALSQAEVVAQAEQYPPARQVVNYDPYSN
jgi:nucleotide-binding universal stress UspA family protein